MHFIALVLTACGVDVRTMPEDQDSTTVDGGVHDGSTTVTDAAPIPPDGIPPGLTPCEEAIYHSDLAWIQREVFDASCLTDCHGRASPAAGLSLRAGESHAALVDARSTQFTSWIRVVPGNPGASMRMVQIGGEPGPEREGLMPWGQPKLCDEKIDAIRRWIASGAPE